MAEEGREGGGSESAGDPEILQSGTVALGGADKQTHKAGL